jgi:DnaK suppressor protein
MDQKQRDHLEQRLQQERERAIVTLRKLDETRLEDDGGLTNWPLHLADEGTDAMEQEKALLLMGQEGRRLSDIDEALRRLYNAADDFGVCERCGNEIAFDRLDLVPWARFCVDCQEAVEESVATEPRMSDAVEDEAPHR